MKEELVIRDDDTLFALTSPPYEGAFLTITGDMKVLISGDIYEAAVDFWKFVQQVAPKAWKLEVMP